MPEIAPKWLSISVLVARCVVGSLTLSFWGLCSGTLYKNAEPGAKSTFCLVENSHKCNKKLTFGEVPFLFPDAVCRKRLVLYSQANYQKNLRNCRPKTSRNHKQSGCLCGLGYQRAEVVLRAPVAAPLGRPRDADDAVTGVEVLACGVDGVQTGCAAAGSGQLGSRQPASR